MRAAVLCPGQGAQRVGMGKDLADRFPAAREVFDAADRALGIELSRLMWEGPEEDLTLTHNAQPAILVHTIAVHAVLGDRLEVVAAAGHSLGEYSAYVVTGALALADAVRLVRRRGELMHEAGTQRHGAMAAVIGLPSDAVERLCEVDSGDARVVVAANFNAPDQTVISGDAEAVERCGEHLKAEGAKRVLPLKVSGAFHSPLMAPARHGLEAELRKVAFDAPAVPVIANATASPVTDADTARDLLGEQLTAPVRWVASMERLATITDGGTFLELGPGTVLSGLLKRIVPGAVARHVGSADDVGAFVDGAA